MPSNITVASYLLKGKEAEYATKISPSYLKL